MASYFIHTAFLAYTLIGLDQYSSKFGHGIILIFYSSSIESPPLLVFLVSCFDGGKKEFAYLIFKNIISRALSNMGLLNTF